MVGLLLLGACQNLDFVPGPGQLVSDLGPESARCRLFARGTPSGIGGFGAAGSPRFVAAAMGTALLADAIGSAVQTNQNFNDCMLARGWRVAQPGATVAAAPTVQPAFEPVQMVATPPPRRRLLVRVSVLPAGEAGEPRPANGEGLLVSEVFPDGAGSAAGLVPGDVLVAFDGAPLREITDATERLARIAANGVITATVWRHGQARPVTLRF